MRTSKTKKNLLLIYKGMQLDYEEVFHKAKMVLEVYRPVVWSSITEAKYIQDEYYSQELTAALLYLSDFAPTDEKEHFQEKVSSLFETKWMLDLVDTAMMKIYDYYDNGRLYHEILSKTYVTAFPMKERELLDSLSLERSCYYEKKKEAIMLFGITLWGFALPQFKAVFDIHSEIKTENLSVFF